MHMDVSGDARARRTADVHPGVEPGRPVDDSEILLRDPGQQHHLGHGVFLGVLKRGYVSIGSNHQVSARIREKVQEDEIVARAMKNEIVLIAIFLGFFAEDTGSSGLGGTDVSVPPGTPTMIHPQL